MKPFQVIRKCAYATFGGVLMAIMLQACDDGVYRFEPGPNAIQPPDIQPVDKTLYEDENLIIRDEF